MGDQADRVTTPFLGMAEIFARAQGDIERILRIAGRAVGAVVVAIVSRCWEPEKLDNPCHIELLAQAGKVYKARHASVLKIVSTACHSIKLTKDSASPTGKHVNYGSTEPFFLIRTTLVKRMNIAFCKDKARSPPDSPDVFAVS